MPKQTAMPSYDELNATINNECLFYQTPRDMALKAVNARLTSAEWSLWTYLQIFDPHGDRLMQLPPLADISKTIGISERQMHRALNRLKDLGLYYWEPVVIRGQNLAGKEAKEICRGKNRKFSEEDKLTKLSLNGQSCQDNDKVVFIETKLSSNGQSCQNQPPEPLPDKASKTPQTSSDYSDFIHTLSDSERESFEKFCKKKMEQLPKMPVLPKKWIESNWKELSEEFQQEEARRKAVDERLEAGRQQHTENEPKPIADSLDEVKKQPTATKLNEAWQKAKTANNSKLCKGIEEQARFLGYEVTKKGIFDHPKDSDQGNSSGRGFTSQKLE